MRIKHVKDVRKENGAGLRSGPVDFSEFTHTDCSPMRHSFPTT
jgi:hypothetical protein